MNESSSGWKLSKVLQFLFCSSSYWIAREGEREKRESEQVSWVGLPPWKSCLCEKTLLSMDPPEHFWLPRASVFQWLQLLKLALIPRKTLVPSSIRGNNEASSKTRIQKSFSMRKYGGTLPDSLESAKLGRMGVYFFALKYINQRNGLSVTFLMWFVLFFFLIFIGSKQI